MANDTNGYRDVFVRDLVAGTNILVSVNTNGIAGDGMSTDPAISGDGRYVAFSSSADNLVPGDTNKAQDVFVRDLQAGTTTLVSVSTDGVNPGNGDSFSPVISADGRYVLFHSKASNLAAGSFGSGVENLFFRDLQTGTTYPLTSGGMDAAAMTPDGHCVAFIGVAPGIPGTAVYVWNSPTGHTDLHQQRDGDFVPVHAPAGFHQSRRTNARLYGGHVFDGSEPGGQHRHHDQFERKFSPCRTSVQQ